MAAPSQSWNQALLPKDRITQAGNLLQRPLDPGKIHSRNIGELLLIGFVQEIEQPANLGHRIGFAQGPQALCRSPDLLIDIDCAQG